MSGSNHPSIPSAPPPPPGAPPQLPPGPGAGAAGDAPKLKTEEEYRIAVHDKLLDARKDATDFVNVYITACYGIVAIVQLYLSGNISHASFFGLDIDLSKGYAIEYVAILVFVAYVLVSFHLLRLARVFRAIRRNGAAINALNPNAKIVTIDDMQLFVSGVTGVILAIARAQTRVIMYNLGTLSLDGFLTAFAGFRRAPSGRAGWKLFRAYADVLLKLYRVTPQLLFRAMLVALIAGFPPLAAALAVAYVKYAPLGANQPSETIDAAQYYFNHLDPVDGVLLLGFLAVGAMVLGSSMMLAMSYSRDLIREFAASVALSLEDVTSSLAPLDLKAVAELRGKLDDWWERVA